MTQGHNPFAGQAGAGRTSASAVPLAVPLAILGGPIGLGGPGFRVPVLVGPSGYAPRRAVPLNLGVGVVTIATAPAIRARSRDLDPVLDPRAAILARIGGAVAAAILGTARFSRLSGERLERSILGLLLVVGVALIAEGFLPEESGRLLTDGAVVTVLAGVLFGLGIGLVSSLLGVARGEVIIPTLVVAHGVDISAAGTASPLVSVPTVAVGILRHARRGGYARRAPRGTVAPMVAGSVIGAVIGGLLVGLVPADVSKVGLGIILIASAVRVFRGAHP